MEAAVAGVSAAGSSLAEPPVAVPAAASGCWSVVVVAVEVEARLPTVWPEFRKRWGAARGRARGAWTAAIGSLVQKGVGVEGEGGVGGGR